MTEVELVDDMNEPREFNENIVEVNTNIYLFFPEIYTVYC